MITRNQVRCGNLFHRIDRSGEVHIPMGFPLKIVTINLFECEVLQPDLNPANIKELPVCRIADLSPIPMTHEILERCGFKRQSIEDMSWWEAGCGKFLFFSSDRPEKGRVVIEYLDEEIKRINYLHELQNWWFLLSGEELIIKFLK